MADLKAFFKFAYVRGLQNGLVQAGAIRPYAHAKLADIAVHRAALKLAEEDVTEVEPSDDSAAEVMGQLVEDSASEDTANAAGSGGPLMAAAVALEELQNKQLEVAAATGDAAQALQSAQAAEPAKVAALRQAAARFKWAMEAPASAIVGIPAAPAPTEVPNKEVDAARPAGYANTPPLANGSPTPVEPFTGDMVSLDAKTAAAILRKLAEGGVDQPAASNQGVSESSIAVAPDKQEDPARPAAYANTPPDTNHVPPFTGDMQDQSGEMKTAAFNFLMQKTAQEVGPFLPRNLPQQAKVAAVRAMIGMTTKERGAYIARIKRAMEEEAPAGEKKEDLMAAIEEAEKSESSSGEKTEDEKKEETKSASRRK